MLSVEDRVRPIEHQVAAKIMDGEAILINLSTGLYYSVGGTGGLIWSLIENQHSLSEIAGVLSEQFGVNKDEISKDIEKLASELLTENLIAVSDADTAVGDVTPETAGLPDSYTAPKLQKYDDMADMFALDPPLPGLADVSADALPERSED